MPTPEENKWRERYLEIMNHMSTQDRVALDQSDEPEKRLGDYITYWFVEPRYNANHNTAPETAQAFQSLQESELAKPDQASEAACLNASHTPRNSLDVHAPCSPLICMRAFLTLDAYSKLGATTVERGVYRDVVRVGLGKDSETTSTAVQAGHWSYKLNSDDKDMVMVVEFILRDEDFKSNIHRLLLDSLLDATS